MSDIASGIIRTLFISTLVVGAGACTAASKTQTSQVPESSMSVTLLGNCTIKAAKITLVDEAILTRAALTADSAAGMGKTTDLAEGDTRLQRLTALLDGTNTVLADVSSIDARLVIRLQCADGAERVISGSSSADQSLFLKVGDKIYRAPATFRNDLEALTR